MNLGASLRHNLSGLLRFSGRDPRWLFWPWAILVFLAAQATYMLLIMLVMYRAMTGVFADVLEAERTGGKPDPARAEAQFANMMSEVADLWPLLLIVHLVALMLLAGSVTRRLHDVERTGWWGVLPAFLLALGVIIMPAWSNYVLESLRTPEPMPPWLILGFVGSMLSWGVVILLIAWMAQTGTPGPNRYGDAPWTPPR